MNVPLSVNNDPPPPLPQVVNVSTPAVPELAKHSLALPMVVGRVNTRFPAELPGVRVVVWPPLPSLSTRLPVEVLVPIVAVLPWIVTAPAIDVTIPLLPRVSPLALVPPMVMTPSVPVAVPVSIVMLPELDVEPRALPVVMVIPSVFVEAELVLLEATLEALNGCQFEPWSHFAVCRRTSTPCTAGSSPNCHT